MPRKNAIESSRTNIWQGRPLTRSSRIRTDRKEPCRLAGYTHPIMVNQRRATLSLLARIRSTQVGKGRGFLTLLVFAWLNVVLQPCAMAMANAACPDCPPAHIHEQMSHAAMGEHDHAMVVIKDERAHNGADGHEIDSGSPTCGSELVDCVNLDDINQISRQEQSTPEPGLAWLVPPPVQCLHAVDHALFPSFRPGDAERLIGAFPPLNILYCVYLD